MHIVPFTLKQVLTFTPTEVVRGTLDPAWLAYQTHIDTDMGLQQDPRPAVPEPGVSALLVLGLAVVAWKRKRRQP